jgi:hypothetical protein
LRRRRASRTMPLRYYIYISDSKLDMLFDQIDQNLLKQISAEVRVDLKLLSVTLRNAKDPAPGRMDKLRIVEHFIDKHHHVGTIENPGHEYFRGQMNMRWGWLGEDGVWFQGSQADGSHCVGLAGSRHHVLGELRTSSYGTSTLPSIVRALERIDSGQASSDMAQAELPAGWLSRIFWGDLPNSLHSTFFQSQNLGFLAVPLLDIQAPLRHVGKAHVVLGTPVYLAMAG